MIMMTGTSVNINYKLVNLMSYKKLNRDVIFFEKNGDKNYDIGGCKVIPYKNLHDILKVVKNYKSVTIVNQDSFCLNDAAIRNLKADTIYFNSDLEFESIQQGIESTEKINFIQFSTKALVNAEKYILKFERELSNSLFLKDEFKDFLVFLILTDQRLNVGRVSIANSKNYLNLKKNDKFDLVKNFIFLDEYKPWLNLENSSYALDHDSKINLLFFSDWYKHFNSIKSCFENSEFIAGIELTEECNQKKLMDYLLRVNYERSNFKAAMRKKDEYIYSITKNKMYLLAGKKEMKKTGWDNKLIRAYQQGNKINFLISFRANKHNAVKLMVNEELFDYKFKMKILSRANGNFYIALFSIDKEKLIDFEQLQTTLFLLRGKKKDFLYDRKFTSVENINNISTIVYDQKDIYYLRNGFDGRVIFQKSKKEYYNTKENLRYSKKVYSDKRDLKYIILYEKNGLHFEESAYRLFKRIYKQPNVFFVLRKDSAKYEEAKKLYGDKIIEPNEKRFYHYIINAKYFIGTESPIHVIGIRSYNKYIRMKVMDKSAKFIFLQHGITYSLSLEGNMRNLFKKGSNLNIDKIVVSSQLEADHWKMYGNFTDENMYKTGLITLDGKKKDQNAQNIVLFLTWRPWEESMYENIEETTYYKDIISIIDSLPAGKIRDNFKVILHPKFNDMEIDEKLKKYVARGSIDSMLNTADILITDYSSVCYDSYYRGSKVIFWWNRTEENMKKYKNKIMLTEDNVFGPICYDNKDIYQIIKKLYLKPQDAKYLVKYKEINEYDDDKNIERLLSLLKSDKILDNE